MVLSRENRAKLSSGFKMVLVDLPEAQDQVWLRQLDAGSTGRYMDLFEPDEDGTTRPAEGVNGIDLMCQLAGLSVCDPDGTRWFTDEGEAMDEARSWKIPDLKAVFQAALELNKLDTPIEEVEKNSDATIGAEASTA